MKSTIDAAGRLVIPHRIRREAGLEAGAELEIRFENGRIEIEPTPLDVKLVKRGSLTVAISAKPVGTLTTEVVEQTRHRLRAGRGGRS
ncbi:MAG: AbrB/MazE/SpoVT family DNA-binding domain-containing protein [Acidobacteriota bacterium]|nr:AbrB/MazE/SpoVT family DNA-binding domain-containing protein [Acidobacteriota bacterium]